MSPEQRSAADNAVWLCQTCAKLIDDDPARFAADVLRDWKRKGEAAALEAIGKTTLRSRPPTPQERDIRRNLKIRQKLERVMLRPISERRLKPRAHPTEQFRCSRVIIRSLNDTKYPEVDVDPPSGISSWLRLQPYDFYHGGLMVVLNVRRVAVHSTGHWAYISSDLDVPDSIPGVAQAWGLGEIPWRNIREVDEDGDSHYSGPHLYCDFADNGRPYERVMARVVGEHNDYPLHPALEAPEVKSLDDLQPASADNTRNDFSSEPSELA
jgi:hypothetical protein